MSHLEFTFYLFFVFVFFSPETVQSCLSPSQRLMGMAAGIPKCCMEGGSLQALAGVARTWSAKELTSGYITKQVWVIFV